MMWIVPTAYPTIFSPVIVDSGNKIVESAIKIQSFRTPATRIVTAPVLPITKNIEKFNASADNAFEKNIQKLNWICEISIPGFSNKHQGTNKNTKLHLLEETNIMNFLLLPGKSQCETKIKPHTCRVQCNTNW